LLIGPWVHGVASTGKARSGEREFGPDAAIDYDEVILRWMDHYLRGMDNGVGRQNPVRYFVMGENQWREAAIWPPPAKAASYYLVPSTSSDVAGELSLESPKAADAFTSFISDPAHPVTNNYSTSGAHDYRELAERSDVLVFDSAVLRRDTEVTGPVQAVIYLACDCRDTDLWVRLLDVAPDGTAFNLMSPGLDVLRASYRDLKQRRQLLTPNQVYELRLNNLITSNVFLKGHRIRVQILGAFFPNFSRNLQTGESEVNSARMQKATISIYADREHPSRVVLPVVVH
jgi:putative CocE/NonD family hydrolase